MLAKLRNNQIPHTFLVRVGNITASLENSLILIKLNIHLPYNPAIALLRIYSREMKTYIHSVNLYTFIHSSFVIAPNWKLLKFPLIGE